MMSQAECVSEQLPTSLKIGYGGNTDYREQCWPPDYDIQIAMNVHNLAMTRWSMNDCTGAEGLFRLATSMKEQLLGPAHPDTAETMHGYASMLTTLGRLEEAWDLEFRAMAAFEASLDPADPRFLAAEQLWKKLNDIWRPQ